MPRTARRGSFGGRTGSETGTASDGDPAGGGNAAAGEPDDDGGRRPFPKGAGCRQRVPTATRDGPGQGAVASVRNRFRPAMRRMRAAPGGRRRRGDPTHAGCRSGTMCTPRSARSPEQAGCRLRLDETRCIGVLSRKRERIRTERRCFAKGTPVPRGFVGPGRSRVHEPPGLSGRRACLRGTHCANRKVCAPGASFLFSYPNRPRITTVFGRYSPFRPYILNPARGCPRYPARRWRSSASSRT